MERITYNGEQVWPRHATRSVRTGQYAHVGMWTRMKAWMWKWAVRFMWTLAGLSVLGGAYGIGFIAHGHEVSAINQITVNAPAPKEQEAPVLARIAKCESGGKQFLADGSVVTHTNADGTVDEGMFEINMSADHIVQMAKLHMDPATEEGNTAYAHYLYENVGTGPWQSSAHCWNK